MAKASDRAPPTYKVQVAAVFDGLAHLIVVWSAPMLPGLSAEVNLEVTCKICKGTVRIAGAALFVFSGLSGETLTEGARKDLRAFRARHEHCGVKRKRTRGIQQEMSGFGG